MNLTHVGYLYQISVNLILKTQTKILHQVIGVSIAHGKILNQHTTIINLKYLLQLGMILLICLMVLILLKTFKTTLNLSSKNMKL